MDTRTKEQRRRIMQAVGTTHTGPELRVRRILWRAGYRYRLHYRRLPGKPDIAFPSRRKVIFVHGCFWHGHSCPKGRPPKTRSEYWLPKIANNQSRDQAVLSACEALGWKALIVWQCEARDEKNLLRRLKRFLGRP